MLSRIKHWARKAELNEKELLQQLLKAGDKERAAAAKKQASDLAKAEKCKAEVDRLFTKMCED